MAKTEEKYYYFKIRATGGQPYETIVTAIPISAILSRIYVEMTDEQRDFYLANPDASVTEVWNCELEPPYVPPAQDVQAYAAQKVAELKQASYDSVSVDDMECAMANAVLAGTAIAYSGDRYYDTAEAKAVMKTFMDESAHAKRVFDTYRPMIEAASTKKIIDDLYDEATGKL